MRFGAATDYNPNIGFFRAYHLGLCPPGDPPGAFVELIFQTLFKHFTRIYRVYPKMGQFDLNILSSPRQFHRPVAMRISNAIRS